MIQYFEINSTNGVKKSHSKQGNWLVVTEATADEQAELIRTYGLPEEIFIGAIHAEEVSHLEPLELDVC